jgi:2,5-diamino-6-(ribosylamino)-4(3H)-pyrimidinone 5'-phosphate reductase
MRPRIICHMASSIDGRIDGASFGALLAKGDYESTGQTLKGDAWICGRTTMERHFAAKRLFTPSSRKKAGRQPVFVARKAGSYAISVDTLGKLDWRSDDVYGDHLICVVSEEAPLDYLTMLRKKYISYVVAGRKSVDLAKAIRLLRSHFGIKRLLLEGGGHINGGFLQAGLIDELSLLLVPGIDGRKNIATVFDGLGSGPFRAVPLRLKSVRRRRNGTLWLRYAVNNSKKKN